MANTNVTKLRKVLFSTKCYGRHVIDAELEFLDASDEVKQLIFEAKTFEEFVELEKHMRTLVSDDIDEVFDRVYIGCYRVMGSADQLQKLGINHIFNVAESPNVFMSPKPTDSEQSLLDKAGIKYRGIFMNDVTKIGQDTALNQVKQAADIIKDILDEDPNNKIVVNCHAGISRSATVVIAYLVLHKNMTAEDALRTVKSKRDVLPSNEYLSHLAKINNVHFKTANDYNQPEIDEDAKKYNMHKFRENFLKSKK